MQDDTLSNRLRILSPRCQGNDYLVRVTDSIHQIWFFGMVGSLVYQLSIVDESGLFQCFQGHLTFVAL